MRRRVFTSPVYWLAVGALVAGALIGDDAPWWVYVLASLGVAVVADSLERWYYAARETRMLRLGASVATHTLKHAEISNSTVPTLPRLCVHAPWAGSCTRPGCR